MLIPIGILGSLGIDFGAYFATGVGNTSSTQKIRFADDTISLLNEGLTVARQLATGFADSKNAGYIVAGVNPSTLTRINSVTKLSFSTEGNSILASSWPASISSSAGLANSGTAGYTGGGQADTSAIYKLTFSNDSISTSSATLSSQNFRLAAASNSGIAGYFAGGSNPETAFSKIDKLLFSNETRSTLSATLSSGTSIFAGLANSGTAGYFAGGFTNATTVSKKLEKLNFSNDTIATTSNWLTTAKASLSGASNSGIAGYFAGGDSGGNEVDKLVFSTDTKSVGNTLINSGQYMAGFANTQGL